MSRRTDYAKDLASGEKYCGNCRDCCLEGNLYGDCPRNGKKRILENASSCSKHDFKRSWTEDDYWRELKYLYVSSAICEVLGLPLDDPFNLSVGVIKSYVEENAELHGLWYEYEAIGWALASCIRTPLYEVIFMDEENKKQSYCFNSEVVAKSLYKRYASLIINLVNEGKINEALKVYIHMLICAYPIYNIPNKERQGLYLGEDLTVGVDPRNDEFLDVVTNAKVPADIVIDISGMFENTFEINGLEKHFTGYVTTALCEVLGIEISDDNLDYLAIVILDKLLMEDERFREYHDAYQIIGPEMKKAIEESNNPEIVELSGVCYKYFIKPIAVLVFGDKNLNEALEQDGFAGALDLPNIREALRIYIDMLISINSKLSLGRGKELCEYAKSVSKKPYTIKR